MQTTITNLGQILSRSDLKNIKGRDDGDLAGRCKSGSCTISVPGQTNAPGQCQENSSNQCVCKALDSANSAVDANCVK